MLPRFHGGDLVVLRRDAEYYVGDIAAYKNPMLHIVVMHRIIAKNGDRYTFRGDNNNFTDPSVIDQRDIIGSPRLHIPQGGKVFLVLRQPLVAAWLFGLLTWWAMREPTRAVRRDTRNAATTDSSWLEMPAVDDLAPEPRDELALAGASALAPGAAPSPACVARARRQAK